MSIREYTCVVCPNGCTLKVEVTDGDHPQFVRVEGNICKRGESWAKQEVENPMRTIASSVLVKSGDFPLASVRTDSPIPLGSIKAVMEEIRALIVDAPLDIGDVVLQKPAGTDCNIIVTRNIKNMKEISSCAEDSTTGERVSLLQL